MEAAQLFLFPFFFLFLLAGQGWPGGAAGSPLVAGGPLESSDASTPYGKPAEMPPAPPPPSYLRWVPFEGQLPPDAVSSWNQEAQRLEFVCATRVLHCNTGAYVPQRGPLCFYPYWGGERSTRDFQILVNVGGFEALEWVEDSFGGVPEGAVEGCPSVDIFVGRSKYGLGKVSREHRALFVVDPQEGEELWFAWYQVLVVKKGPAEITLGEVFYDLGRAVEEPPEEVTLGRTILRNQACHKAPQAVTMREDTEVEQDWQLDQRIFATLQGVLEVSPLTFNGTSWEVAPGAASSLPWAGGASSSLYVTHSLVVEQELEALTACQVAMEGRRREVRVPFSATLRRDFGHGRLHRLAVTGWARGRAVGEVRAGLKECWPIPAEPPCQG